jgi:hypothetical protein
MSPAQSPFFYQIGRMELGQFMSFFCHKTLDLGLCGWGLPFKHKFTGKNA